MAPQPRAAVLASFASATYGAADFHKPTAAQAQVNARCHCRLVALAFCDLHISKKDFPIFTAIRYAAVGTSARAC